MWEGVPASLWRRIGGLTAGFGNEWQFDRQRIHSGLKTYMMQNGAGFMICRRRSESSSRQSLKSGNLIVQRKFKIAAIESISWNYHDRTTPRIKEQHDLEQKSRFTSQIDCFLV
jgi:hypothetical protein